MKPQKDNLNEAARQLKEGNLEAGKMVFDHFAPAIFRFFFLRTSNRGMAEDLTQEVFLKIVSKINTFNDSLGSFSPWVWQITRNTLIDHYRIKQTIPFSDFLNESDDIENKKENQITEIRAKEIISYVKNFSEEEQEIFSLFHISGLSYKELSVLTNKTEANLRVIIHRISKKIKNHLGE